MAKTFVVPFAAQGDKIVVPDELQQDGSVSFNQGFGFDYERPNTDPAYKPIPRDGFNGLLHDVTEAIGVIQKQGYADWSAQAAPYNAAATVAHGGAVWISAIGNNSSEPGIDTNWLLDGFATKAEAETNDEATANNTKRMTPLRVLQAIKARISSASETVAGMLRIGTQAEVDEGVLDDVAVTPKKLRMGFSTSLTPNGYIVFPSWLGGLIVQWGKYTGTAGSGTISFPIGFPGGRSMVLMTPTGGEGTGSSQVNMEIDATTSTSSFNWYRSGTQVRFGWICVGW